MGCFYYGIPTLSLLFALFFISFYSSRWAYKNSIVSLNVKIVINNQITRICCSPRFAAFNFYATDFLAYFVGFHFLRFPLAVC